MVYCTRCGTLNVEDATVCTSCGAPLPTANAQIRPYHRRWQWEDSREYRRRSGAFAALALGLMIVFIGFAILAARIYNVNIPWGVIVLVFIGLLILAAGIRARLRWSRK